MTILPAPSGAMRRRDSLRFPRYLHGELGKKPRGGTRCGAFCSSVGASGFEPPTSWSRTRRANRAALRPELLATWLHAPRRTRTPSLLIRSQALYPVELWARVGGTRLELVTSTMSTWRSNQLS